MLEGTSELKYLLSKESIPDKFQAILYSVGVTTVAKFGSLCKDQDELRKLLKEDLGLDADTGLRERVQRRLLSLRGSKKLGSRRRICHNLNT